MSVLGQAVARRAAAVLAVAPVLMLALAAAGIAPAAAMNRPATIEITSVTGQRSVPDQPLLVVHVSNKGSGALDLFGELRLTNGPSGSTAGPFRVTPVVSLEPGMDMDVDFALPAALPSGPWLATVTLTSGQDSATAKSTVTFAGPKVSWSWVTVAWMVTGASIVIALIIVGLSLVARGMPA
jgi:hypothetical protein